MALELDDAEFWLPSGFLSDDDFLADFEAAPRLRVSNGCGNFLGDLGSPVESVYGGSTETESDEDDVVLWLTRKPFFGSYSLFSSDYRANKEWKMYGSPQSTLSLNWDLPCLAAAELASFKMAESTPQPTGKWCAASFPVYSQSSQNDTALRLAYLQLQASQFQKMKQQQQMMQSRPLRQAPVPPRGTFSFPSSQQPVHPHRPVSSIKTSLPRDTPVRRERNGTGVFLPRLVSPDPRKKQAAGDRAGSIKRGFSGTNQEIGLPKEWIY